jgi:hypothetical protein
VKKIKRNSYEINEMERCKYTGRKIVPYRIAKEEIIERLGSAEKF